MSQIDHQWIYMQEKSSRIWSSEQYSRHSYSIEEKEVYRGLARARRTHKDHMIVCKNVCRLSSVVLGLQNDGLELVEHLFDVIHVVQIGKSVAR